MVNGSIGLRLEPHTNGLALIEAQSPPGRGTGGVQRRARYNRRGRPSWVGINLDTRWISDREPIQAPSSHLLV